MSSWLGFQPKAMASEQLVATLGGMLSLFFVCTISFSLLDIQGAVAVITSMGAATVLLFAVPHGPLSQPWAIFGGNIISAFVGVSCNLLVNDMAFAAALAVGLAIGAMHLCRCIHPPGGATALTAVIGGQQIVDLGYFYLISPVLLNCSVIFIVALVFNNFFPWRKYPFALMRFKPIEKPPFDKLEITEQHIEQAMTNIGTVFDISPEQLKKVYNAANEVRRSEVSHHFDFHPGGVYTNNLLGAQWSVRKIIDFASHPNPAKSLIIYKVLSGQGKNTTNSCTRAEFADWASQRLHSTKERKD
ncbi:HPP family protein [Thalassotalea agariperforans]